MFYSHEIISNVQAQSVVELKAFPEAEGFGKKAKGGRGGKVFEVTNLNDSGTGSLRACAEASGPRTCVFRVSGTIETQDIITIKNPYITIAGQSAPGEGITLKAAPSYSKGSLAIRTHDVIIRHIRFRTGASTSKTSNRRGITVESSSDSNQAHNIILDHVSISWATDDNLTLIDGVTDFTVQWSIISEGLSNSTHSEGEHSKGLAISGKMYQSSAKTGNVSVHHNLLAHNNDRNARHAAWGTVDFVNNVIYNWGFSAFEANDGQTNVPANIIGNYYKRGPSTKSSAYEVNIDTDEGNGARVFVQGNIGPHRTSTSNPENAIVNPKGHSYLISTRLSAPPITTTSASDAYNAVLANAGARKPSVDIVDQRVLQEVKNGTGRIIDDPSQVGGWPNLSQVTQDGDADNDGMDDPWEISQFGNTSRGSATNSSSDYDGDGYTDLEEFLNGTNPKVKDTGAVTASPTPTPTVVQNPSPTVSVTSTPTQGVTPSTCPKKVQGDANCDGKITIDDFECWRSEALNTKSAGCKSADFDSSGGKPNEADYLIWKSNFRK